MKTIFGLALKSAIRDPFLLFWSIILPVAACIGLGKLIKSPAYPLQILTGMMAVSIFFYAFMTTAYTNLAQRRRGVYQLLRVTPMPLWKYVCSISAAWTLISTLCGIFILIIGMAVFQIRISMQSFILIIAVVLMATIGYVLLSFFFASLSRTEANLSMTTNILALPLLFCSNGFYSLAGAPKWIQAISLGNPFQWFINGLRSAITFDYRAYLINIGLLLIAVFVFMIFALKTFRYTDG